MRNESKWIRYGILSGEVIEEPTWSACVQDVMQRAGQQEVTDEEILDWIEEAKQRYAPLDDHGMEALFDPRRQALPYHLFDGYVRGIVRMMNELGILTSYCCDGHGKRAARVYTQDLLTNQQRYLLRLAADAVPGLTVSLQSRWIQLEVREQRSLLLDLAEVLYRIKQDASTIQELELQRFRKRLLRWLAIPGQSRREQMVRSRVQQAVRRFADDSFIDEKGNLLVTYHQGKGPVILLSAHLDTVERIDSYRTLFQEGTILTSSNGILGADDRAGIAAILELMERIPATDFRGTIKLAFSVEEEIGCRGAEAMDASFLEDVDATIVFDRRGTRDIVTGCHGEFDFCETAFGACFEQAGLLSGMPDWRTTRYGGSSDAKLFALRAIPAVNLSVGYLHEHTDFEQVDFAATLETVRLVETLLHHRLLERYFAERTENPTLGGYTE
ncbi:M20/M25/M40 family metallo-hydrolase [Exiguobacterium acetylicum]|uniref:M20/M25/M40 family metallo-hydrolase n=1 Tax=Exiguobacterium acetylicum TaxID=41170 RepID=UPI0034D7511D